MPLWTALDRKTRMLVLAYLPFFFWSLIGGIWTAAHYRVTFSFGLAYLVLCAVSFAFKRRLGAVPLMLGIAAFHALAAFALHASLRLPLWTSPVFFVVSLALMLVVSVRVLNRRPR
jgi:hypothetical protein